MSLPESSPLFIVVTQTNPAGVIWKPTWISFPLWENKLFFCCPRIQSTLCRCGERFYTPHAAAAAAGCNEISPWKINYLHINHLWRSHIVGSFWFFFIHSVFFSLFDSFFCFFAGTTTGYGTVTLLRGRTATEIFMTATNGKFRFRRFEVWGGASLA